MFLFKFIFHQLLSGSQSRRILSTSTCIKYFKMNRLISRLSIRSVSQFKDYIRALSGNNYILKGGERDEKSAEVDELGWR